jgi:CTP-dependent riboflavin kinase
MEVKMKYQGIVTSGSGSSSRWMPDYLPTLYPGTLNIKLLDKPKPEIKWHTYIKTDHWRGDWQNIRIADCKINNLKAYLISPPRAESKVDNPYFIEIGLEIKLRDHFNLVNGSIVEIEFI